MKIGDHIKVGYVFRHKSEPATVKILSINGSTVRYHVSFDEGKNRGDRDGCINSYDFWNNRFLLNYELDKKTILKQILDKTNG